jgi:hypothetical protein
MAHIFDRRVRPWALLALALAGATLACTIVPGPVETAAPLPPAETQPPVETQPPPSSGGFTVVNDTGETLCYLYISPTSSDTWGDDWLGSTGTIGNGESRSFDVAPGDYDLRAEDCDTARLGEIFGVTVTASGYTWSIPFVPITVRMVNASSTPVCYVFISPSSQPTWGGDWLGHSEIIDPGDSRDFAVPPGQDFDMMAADCSQNTLDDQRGIAITTNIYTWTIGP